MNQIKNRLQAVERLQNLHTEYEAKRRERVEEEVNKPQVKSEEGRDAIQAAVTDILSFVDLMGRMTESAELEAMNLRLEAVAAYMNARINSRMSNTDEGTETTETITVPENSSS